MRCAVTCSLLAVLAVAAAAAPGGWPDLLPPPLAERTGASDEAVVIAIQDYVYVQDIPGALENGDAWRQWLEKTRGVPEVKWLLDRAATKEEVLRAAREVAGRARPGGTVWFVFIGHGHPIPGVQKDVLLLGADVQPTANSLAERGLRRSELDAALSGGKQKSTVVVLDACFTGSGTRGEALVSGLEPALTSDSWRSSRLTVLSAAKADQVAGPPRPRHLATYPQHRRSPPFVAPQVRNWPALIWTKTSSGGMDSP
jgi:hypothetical protein